jgi:endonuclease YncB( thermonuclease family)
MSQKGDFSSKLISVRRSGFCLIAIAILSLLGALSAEANSIRVIDGDGLEIDGVAHRLFGIDAPEQGQKCDRKGGGNWSCGKSATRALQKLIEQGSVQCQSRGQDEFGRELSLCTAGSMGINRQMVVDGYAWAFFKYSDIFEKEERIARSKEIGIWQAPTEQ